MSRALNKTSRMGEIEDLLLAHPEGLTPADLARKLNVNRSTVGRYLPDLPKHIYIDEADGGRWKIDRQAYLFTVRLNLNEALALHLATRLLATRMDRQNRHAASSLRKVGLSLGKLAPDISKHMLQSASLVESSDRIEDQAFLSVLETLTVAWAEKRKVRLTHLHETGQAITYTFSTYFIEPYAVGQSVHIIGLREPPGALRTFKVDRIKRVDVLRDTYSIPTDFEPTTLLSDAWGIWFTDRDPIEVWLKFNTRVARRVQETAWHRSQIIEEQSDGSIIWRAFVAQPKEMLPWIRGWGADVEVLQPDWLRTELIKEAQRLAQVYGVGMFSPGPHFSLWGKASKKMQITHPLLYHMIDVGEAAKALWHMALPDGIRRDIAARLMLSDADTCALVCFWAALHDLGKASPAFQRLYAPAIPLLEKLGFAFPPAVQGTYGARHNLISGWALVDLLSSEAGMTKRAAKQVARMLGGHHGSWLLSAELNQLHAQSKDVGSGAWNDARRQLVLELKELYHPPAFEGFDLDRNSENVILTILSGFVSIADWIGSSEDFFPFYEQALPASQYASIAAGQAQRALQELGWLSVRGKGVPLSFDGLFGFGQNIYQECVLKEAGKVGHPALIILEAPTGTGKTEAGLSLAYEWSQSEQQSGLYVAMPTQATSNQMYARTLAFLQRCYPEEPVNLRLVHGQAMLQNNSTVPTPEDGEMGEDDNAANYTWFLPSKRSLLAPYGVGTVDQALLGVLQTRHFFVRLFGLDHKTMIFDEVHAYDTYMSKIFGLLLRWLREMGTSVILLSATLPEKTRRELAAAYLDCDVTGVPTPEAHYPRLTIASDGAIRTIALPPPEGGGRTVRIEWIGRESTEIINILNTSLSECGQAAVICNTVRRAQELYAAISSRMAEKEDTEIILFHARYPSDWRRQIEERVLSKYGKKGDRSKRSIVIATQVIEQSLDLDFDLMITDLAPVDLLLQRAGRLHRHSIPSRPAALSEPRLLITRPEEKNGLPTFGSEGMVYAPYLLLKTYLLLEKTSSLRLPDETSVLIETVYGEKELASGASETIQRLLEREREDFLRKQREAEYEAAVRLIPPPDDEDLLKQTNSGLEEDNPAVHEAMRALTRLSDPGISLICLHRTDKGLALEPDGTGAPVDLASRPNHSLVVELLKRSVKVQHWEVVRCYLQNQSEELYPTRWKDIPALRYQRLAVFDRGSCLLPGTSIQLRLSRELGLEIRKLEVK